MKRRHVLSIASLVPFLLMLGCGEAFEEVPISTIEDEAKASRMATAVSWWYLGESDGYYYLVVKRPLDHRRYKVKTTELVITSSPKELAFEESQWINLKFEQMKFEHPASGT
jgi:hypothetical protein